MTDIVEKLNAPMPRQLNWQMREYADGRTEGPFDPVRIEAANEITRLRALLTGQVQDVAVFGPFAHLNGVHGLSEEDWTVDSDPDKNDDERFSIPLFSLVDPFSATLEAKPEGA